MRRSAAFTVLALSVACGTFACRDATEPFRPIDRETDGVHGMVRVTYAHADDRTPAWSVNGDSIHYVTSSWEGNPLAPRTILSVPVDGSGPASTLLRNVQEGSGLSNWIDAPAVTEGGNRVAFVFLNRLQSDAPCAGTRVCPTLSNLPLVRLTRGELHVRVPESTSPLAEDVILPLEFSGRSLEPDPGVPGGLVMTSDYHPFQYEFETTGRAFFRPSWSPDGVRLVVSDGLRLLVWQLGAAAPTPIAGTDDGISPAWSPTGEWIAFTRHERLSSSTYMCEYQNVYPDRIGTDCYERRTTYETAPPVIVLVRPDGSEQRVLGPGADPAWSPDGSHVFASASGHIVRIALDDGETTSIAGTDRGIEPAVSPDGSRLAFARMEALAKPPTHDIWIVDLP